MLTIIGQFFQTIHQAIGLDVFFLTPLLHMLIRGVIVYFCGVTLVRFNKKMMGIHTPFNFILFIMLGSIFANAIVDEKLFISILTTILMLMVLNRLLAMLAFYIPAVELFIKGEPLVLVKNGEIQWPAMQENFITKRELIEELNTQMHTHSLKNIKSATLGSDGNINFIEKK